MRNIIIWCVILMGITPFYANASVVVFDELKRRQVNSEYDYKPIDINTCTSIVGQGIQFIGNTVVYDIHCKAGFTEVDRYTFFWDCDVGYYETGRRKQAVTASGTYPGDIRLLEFFQGFCAPCPTYSNASGNTVNGETPRYSLRQGDITDCRVSTSDTLSDSSGKYSFSEDCHYVK